MGAFGLALLGATWRLWTPQQVFPQVPLFRWGLALDAPLQWALASTMVVGLLFSLAASLQARLARWGLVAFALSTVLLAAGDQQRIQPWAYGLVLTALILAMAPPSSAVGWLRMLFVSFYFYSALSKFDYSFLHMLGQQFLAALVSTVGGSVDDWSRQTRLVAAAIFPAAELAVALGLCFTRARRPAVVAAVTLHGLLLAILGPWGLNHRPAVLIWNVLFAVQDVLLFWPASRVATVERREKEPRRIGEKFVATIAVAAMALPLLAPTAWFDIWPSWGLYASCAERTALLIHRQAFEELPPGLGAYCTSSDDPHDPWLVLRLDQLALAMLAAPIYPQNRSQLGVAEAVIERYQLIGRARVVQSELADRWTGDRESRVLAGLPQVVAAGDDYLFNTHARGNFSGFNVAEARKGSAPQAAK